MRLLIAIVALMILTTSLFALSGTFLATLPFVLIGAYMYWNHDPADD